VTKTHITILTCFIFLILYTQRCFAEEYPLEITAQGHINLNSFIHLSPQANPPSSPSNGDLYPNVLKNNWKNTYFSGDLLHGLKEM